MRTAIRRSRTVADAAAWTISGLILIWEVYEPDEIKGRVEYL
jgi:hypothetical protein